MLISELLVKHLRVESKRATCQVQLQIYANKNYILNFTAEWNIIGFKFWLFKAIVTIFNEFVRNLCFHRSLMGLIIQGFPLFIFWHWPFSKAVIFFFKGISFKCYRPLKYSNCLVWDLKRRWHWWNSFLVFEKFSVDRGHGLQERLRLQSGRFSSSGHL